MKVMGKRKILASLLAAKLYLIAEMIHKKMKRRKQKSSFPEKNYLKFSVGHLKSVCNALYKMMDKLS